MAKEIPYFRAKKIQVNSTGTITTDPAGNMIHEDVILGPKTLSELFNGPAAPPATSWKSPSASDPPLSSSTEGDMYFNTVLDRLRQFNDTQWVTVDPGKPDEEYFEIGPADEANGYVTLDSDLVSPFAAYEVFLNGLRVNQPDVAVDAITKRLSLLNEEVLEDGDDLTVLIYPG